MTVLFSLMEIVFLFENKFAHLLVLKYLMLFPTDGKIFIFSKLMESVCFLKIPHTWIKNYWNKYSFVLHALWIW